LFQLNSHTYKFVITKLVQYVPSITSRLLMLYPLGRHTHVRIRQTSSPIPSSRSKIRWMGVPLSPAFWHPHCFSFASRKAEKSEEKNIGRMLIAGFTRPDVMPEMNRRRKAGGNVASDMARRVCTVDFVEILILRTGPAMVAR
jgi:hypothetical protein